jgi:Carboxypeptidase regulatory-like domain
MPRHNELLLRIAVCFVFMLAPSLLHAQSGTGSVGGMVSDHQGSPLAGAQVTLTSLDTKQSTGGSTDGTGAYIFVGLKPGRYTLLFESKGLISKTQSVSVKAGHKSNVSERLKPPYVPHKTDVD